MKKRNVRFASYCGLVWCNSRLARCTKTTGKRQFQVSKEVNSEDDRKRTIFCVTWATTSPSAVSAPPATASVAFGLVSKECWYARATAMAAMSTKCLDTNGFEGLRDGCECEMVVFSMRGDRWIERGLWAVLKIGIEYGIFRRFQRAMAPL